MSATTLSEAGFEIDVFGTTTVRTPDTVLALDALTPAKPRQLLEILTLARGQVVVKPVLADKLWSGSPPRSWPTTLEGYVAVLRRLLQPGVPGRATIVRTAPGGYRLDLARTRVDLDVFDDLSRTSSGGPDALQCLVRAAELARPDVLEHERYAEWPQAVRRDYQRRGVRAAVTAARAALDAHQIDLALDLAGDAVRRDPLAEDGWQVLITAHGQAGRSADAARAFQACARRMTEELGVGPGDRTRRALALALADETPEPVTAG
jgi:DNA-binding SARP family transcriptional activator